MKLMTKTIENKIPALRATDGTDARVYLKLFTPFANKTWWLTEYDPISGDLFGITDDGFGGKEYGYSNLKEFESLGNRIERDMYWNDSTKISEVN